MTARAAGAMPRVGWLGLGLVLAAPFGLAIREDVLARRAAAAEAPPAAAAERPPPVAAMSDDFFAALGPRPHMVAPEALAGFDRLTVRADERYAAAPSLGAGLFLEFPDHDGRAERELTRRWGEPHRAVDVHGIARSFWLDGEFEIRAGLESSEGRARLELRRYRSFDRMVTELHDDLAAAVALQTAILPPVDGDAGPEASVIEYADESFPPAEFSDAVSEVRRWRTGGRLDAIEIEVDFIYDPGWAEQAIASLTVPFGTPERDPSGRLLFPGSPRMIVVADRAIGRLSVEIRP